MSLPPASLAPAPLPVAPRPPALHRTGAFCARHPVWVIAVWLLVLAAAFAGRHAVGATFGDQVSLPGSQTGTGADLLEKSDPAAGAAGGKVVFHVGSGKASDHAAALETSLALLKDLPHVTAVAAPVTSSDGATAYTAVSFDQKLKALGHGYTDRLDTATAPARDAGIGVGYGGDLHDIVRAPADDAVAEATGVGAALIVLLLAFGSVAAALMPLVTALISVGVGLGVVGVVAGTLTFATSAPTLATMIGLGVASTTRSS